MAQKVTTGGAAIKFDVYSDSSLIGQYRSETLIGTTDWQKLSVSYSTEEIKSQYPTATHIQFVAQARGATAGTIYFDAMRMSEKATVTSYSYDAAGNYLQGITNPLGKKVTLTVDKHGNPLTVTDPRQNVTRFTYDDLDALKTVQNANNLLTEYSYDQAGNLLAVTQKDGLTLELLSTTSSVYNELGLVTQVIDPMNQITEFRYDQNGNLVHIKTASGQEAWLTYDGHDRLATVQYLQEQAGQMLVFSYDKNSNRTNVVHKTGNLADPDHMVLQERYSYSYEYDALNRATRVRLPNGRTVNYTYNPASQVTSIGNSEVSTVNYSYDYTGLNTAANEDISGATSYIYDELGRIIKSMRGKNGVALTTHVQYDAIGQITRYQTVNNSGIVAEHVYEYDDNGNRIRDKKLDGSYVVYKYDQVNQLVAEEYFPAQGVSTRRIGYTYSPQGNRLAKEVTEDGNTVTTTYSYNAANELTNIDGKTISYEDGNQLHTGSNSLEFNALGQLLKVYTADGQQLLEQYEYNADGLRTAKLDGSGNVLEQYIYNGSKLAYVTDGGNNLLYYFTRNASGTLLSFVDCTEGAKVAYWYVTDAHGNVVGLTNASGELVVSYAYDAWGNELSSTGAVTTANGAQLIKDSNPFRYSGYYYDQAAGLYYLNARYYSPELGRFLSRDPAHMESNLYSYCGNEPIMYADADGLAPLAIVFRAALTAPSLLTFGAYVIGAALVFTAIEYGIPALVSFAQSFRAKSSSSVSASVQPTSGGSPGSPPEDDKDKDKYTKDNFRRNLIKHTGRVVTAATQAHHIFPKEFEPFFKTVGIQIHNPKYGVWLEKTLHLSPHHKYNSAWLDFIRRWGGTIPSIEHVMEYGRQLMQQFYGGW